MSAENVSVQMYIRTRNKDEEVNERYPPASGMWCQSLYRFLLERNVLLDMILV